MRPFRVGFLIVLLLLLGSAGVAAQARSDGEGEGEELRIVLLTMGTGDFIWEKYGHNALWVHDPVRGTDAVYNYGVFDFDSPGYWGRFIRGDWLYQLAVWDIQQTVAQYEYFNRTIVAQELDLTGAQKAELAAFLRWNALPQNREYRYDYFRDNCSTRIRDAIDRAVGGALREATDTIPTGTSYRWHSRRLIAGEPVVYTGLHAGLGPAADRPISAWEEMFLPEKVMERVRELRVGDPDGELHPLVKSERVLYRAQGRAADRQAPPSWIPVFLAIGVLVAAAMALLAHGARRSRMARAGFVMLGATWSLLIGIGGLLLVGLWAFTNHTAAHRNENLFQFDPLALPLVVLLPAAVYGARWAGRPAAVLALGVAAISVLGLGLQLLPGLDQVNGEIIALLLPVNVALAWGMGRAKGEG